MSINNNDSIPEQEKLLLDELQSLLQKQTELAYQGNSAGREIEVLGRRADRIVEKIAQAGFLDRPEYKNQRDKLKKSYHDLHLTITAQKADVTEKLGQVRRGKKIVETYRENN